ncbi:MAG: C39 family peptidase [Anaerolineae bacterium]|nr:C39 family peptidase [Anaerolineae bacterium]
MASDKRHTPPNVPKVPSNVPNDYEHLGVPGSLNIPLHGTSRKRRPHARRRGSMPGWGKALLAIGGALAAFGLVALVIGIIAFPPFFRGLEPRYQERIIEFFPLATYLKPTVPFEVLPTLSGASDEEAAQQLLLTQDTTPTETPLPQAGDITQDGTQPVLSPTPTVVLDEGGSIPIGQVNTPVPTPLPVYESANPADAPTWTAIPPTEAPLPAQQRLYNIHYEQQGWNNCGPTTMTMALSYFGWSDNQYTAAKWMKPHTEDKNVSPWQMVRFVNENTGIKALYRIGGSTQLLKRLIAAGFPVVVEEGFQPAGEDWMGHYLLLIGYDDYGQYFLAFDSYLGSNQGEGKQHPYSVLDENWRHFNRVFMVPYDSSLEPALRTALGDYVDPDYAARTALETARAEASKDNEDKWAWFNMGSSYVALEEYDSAAIAFDRAFQLYLPWRMMWYQFGPYESYYEVGRYNDVLTLAEQNRNITPYVEETYYWQGMVYAAQGDTERALIKFNEALKYNRNFFPAQEAKAQVEAGTFPQAYASNQ